VPGYTYPGTDILKNKFGATTHDELQELEADYVAARYAEIQAGYGPPPQFDAEHLKALHRHLFQDVYEWAGHTRDEQVPLRDGSIATQPSLKREGSREFTEGLHIASALDTIAGELRAANYLGGLSRDEFAARAAELLAALNSVHPFREGNGRTQQAFVEQLAQAAGHDLDFAVISKERMIVASIAAHEQNDLGPMRRLFADASDPARQEALRAAIDAFDRQQFPWNDRYIATAEPGHPVELTMAGVAGAHFMARTESQILIGHVVDLPEPRPERGQAFTLVPTHDMGGANRTEDQEKAERQVAENQRQGEHEETQKPRYDRYTGEPLGDQVRSHGHNISGGRGGRSR
jgi:cell filamentation protein